MRYLSLFSGIEAASVALEPLGWTPVAFAEIESFPCKLLKARWPDVPNLGDVTKITEADVMMLGQVDVVIFGSPCQDLSVAGKRKGLAGERSGLFNDAMRIIGWARQWCGLRWAWWENVPGAFTSNKGADFGCVLQALAGDDCELPEGKKWGNEGIVLGSEALVEWSTLDAQWFGVAQRRRRVFAIADFGDWASRPPILLEPQGVRGDSVPSREAGQGVAGTLKAGARNGGDAGQDGGGLLHVVGTLDRQMHRGVNQQMANNGLLIPFGGNNTSGAIDVAAAVNAKGGAGRMDFESETLLVSSVTGDVTHALNTANNGKHSSEDGTGRGVPIIAFSCKDYGADASVEVAPTMRSMGHDGSHANAGGQLAVIGFNHNAQACQLPGQDRDTSVADSLTCSQGAAAAGPFGVRRLTPTECERLQGFRDGHTALPRTADGPRYKALGNSMAVPVINWIGRSIEAASWDVWA